MVPVGLRKQVSTEAQVRFVVNRGFEKCLALYPYDEWQRISAEVNKLNLYNKKNRDFARYFFRGATELSLDGNGRVLMPKPLLGYAGIGTELVLRSEEHTSELQSLMRISYAVFCL